jgi:hypothetical protein
MLSIAAVMVAVFAGYAAEKGKVVIKGSTTVLPITRKPLKLSKPSNQKYPFQLKEAVPETGSRRSLTEHAISLIHPGR